MQSTNIPSKIPVPFANAAGSSYKNTIPTASQIGITNGKASLTDGFPPLTFQAISSGGVPPFGADFNGILYEITAIQQWQEAGGFFPFDASFASTIGGYPKGSILQSSSLSGLWVSTIENNSNNPDTGGSGWTSFAWEGVQAIAISSATTTLTQLQSAYPIVSFSGTLTANSTVNVPAQAGEWIFVNGTTGSYTLTVKTPSGTGVTLTQGQSTYVYGDGTNMYYADSSKVSSFNGRVGSVTLNATDVTNALGYVPVPPVGTGATGTWSINISGNAATSSDSINNAQSWVNVSGSRATGVTYTNSTGRPITVIIMAASDGVFQQMYVNGNNVLTQSVPGGSSMTNGGTFIVPSGQTYACYSPQSSFLAWWELR